MRERGSGRPDDDLGRLLGEALDDGLRHGPVDGAALLAGARVGARRIRRRRTVAAAVATALVVAVPVGALTVGRGDTPAPVASEGDGEPSPSILRETVPPPTASPEPTTPEAPEVDASTLAPDENAVDIPSEVGLTPTDLPVPTEMVTDLHYRALPVVNGQECPNYDQGPIAGYSQGFTEAGSTELQQVAVYVSITAWSRGDGPTAFADARDDTGECRFQDDVQPEPWVPSVGAEGFRFGGFLEANEAGTAVLRVGDLLVGVQSSGAQGAYDYVELSTTLSAEVGQRLVDARVPGSAAP